MGGAVKCIELGYQQEEIARSAYDYEKQIESGDKIIGGVNKYVEEENKDIRILQVDESIQKKQIDRLTKLKKSRDNKAVENSLNDLKKAADSNKNIIPYILKCGENYCTIGEISNSLRQIWGEYDR